MKGLSLSISLADQRFDKAKSLGILNTSLGLCRAVAERAEVNRLTVLTNPSLPRIGESDKGRVVSLDCAGRHIGKLWRLWWDQVGAYRSARRSRNEWLLLPKGYASFTRSCPVKLAPYVHDVIQEYYHERYPGAFPRFENWYFLRSLRAAMARSDLILVNSEFTAAELRRMADKRRIRLPRVVVVGIGFEPVLPNPPKARTRIIILASKWPHKRTDLAVRYFSRWQQERRFEGNVEWVGQLPDGIALPARETWRLHKRLPPGEFNALMAEARTMIYFSDYEGFGMPPVEAALSGACPVYSDIPSTREVMREAGRPFENDHYESFAAALDGALRTTQEEIKLWAAQLLARHNWQAVGERTIRALQDASARPV